MGQQGRKRGGAVARWLTACCAAACWAPCFAGASGTNATPDRVVSRFRVGPLFEYRETHAGGTYWALRPFYSRVTDPVSDTRVTDVVWPLGTFHRSHEQSWWRMVLAYGSDNDVNRDDSAWKVALFPLYFQGRTRQEEDYRALFPIYGHLPHILLMDDIDFVLFPLYLNYEVNGVGREYYLWPVFARTEKQPGVKRTGVFPIYGRTQRRESSHLYAFWPFWTSAVYDAPRNPGSSWMLFPVCGKIDRAKEQQRLFLPPFFSHATTDVSERWRMPWPFYETVTTPTAAKRSYWPLYGDLEREDERRWYAAWPLIEHFTLKGKGRRTERSRFFPFYVGETVYETDAAGVEREAERYLRVWPLFAREESDGGSHVRVLELSLMRYSGGIERNWAPFWTVYDRIERAGDVTHDALWGLFKYHRAGGPAEAGENVP